MSTSSSSRGPTTNTATSNAVDGTALALSGGRVTVGRGATVNIGTGLSRNDAAQFASRLENAITASGAGAISSQQSNPAYVPFSAGSSSSVTIPPPTEEKKQQGFDRLLLLAGGVAAVVAIITFAGK